MPMPARGGERGSVAIMVALTLGVLLMIAGAAIDVIRIIYVKDQLQAAMDGAMTTAAALAVSETSGTTPDSDKMKSIANNYFTANNRLNSGLVTGLKFVPQYVNTAAIDDSMTGTLDADVVLTLGRLFGINTFHIHLDSVAQRPRPSPVQLAIVADVTGSMNDPFGATTKIAALKTAATNLVTTLMKGDYVRVGLLPFGGYVRLDASLYHDPTTMIVNPNVGWLNIGVDPNIKDCVSGITCTPVAGTCYKDGVPYSCPSQSCTCSQTKQRAWYWNGCVYFRPAAIQPDGTSPRTDRRNPSTVPYVAIASSGTCGVLPIITDLVIKDKDQPTRTYTLNGINYNAEGFLKAKISAFRTIGPTYIGTYLTSGLIWAWNMVTAETKADGSLDNNYPLNAGYTPAEVKKLGVRRAIVLITDGNNSMFALETKPYGLPITVGYPYPIQAVGQTAAMQANNLAQTTADMATTCKNMRDDGVEIYVVALQIGSDTAFKSLLQQCASNNGVGTFFATDNPTELNDAFAQIARSFSYNSLKK